MKCCCESLDGLGGATDPHPALGKSAVQIYQEVWIDRMRKRAIRYLLGRGCVADSVQCFGQMTDEAVMPV